MRVETVLFDLDETLIEEEASNDASALAACALAHQRHGVDVNLLLSALRTHSRELWGAGPALEYCRDIGISSREGLWGAFTGDASPHLAVLREWIPGYRVDAWRRALAQMGVDDTALAGEMAELFMADRKRRHVVFPESRALLEHLGSRVKLGMITNGASDIQRDKILGSELAEFFDLILVSGEEGFGKPKPEIFRLAIDRLNADESSAVMIGDSLARDVAGAAGVGIKSVWVNRFGRTAADGLPAPDVEMRDLTGLIRWLEKVA
jgi:putative hydrolase of the HAD superfamily